MHLVQKCLRRKFNIMDLNITAKAFVRLGAFRVFRVYSYMTIS